MNSFRLSSSSFVVMKKIIVLLAKGRNEFFFYSSEQLLIFQSSNNENFSLKNFTKFQDPSGRTIAKNKLKLKLNKFNNKKKGYQRY